MKKDQGAPRRKTLLETIYGPAAEGEAGRHLALVREYERALAVLEIKKKRAGQTGLILWRNESERTAITTLKDQIFESWQRIIRQPQTLLRLARAAEQQREGRDSAFPVERGVLMFYEAGVTSYQKLFEIAERINPSITKAGFSRIVKRYGMALSRAKGGRPAR